jgi:hypothetical protein
MPEISGRCACGKVSYSASADLIFTGVCHCKSCQRTSGSAFTTVIAVPEPSLSVQGTTKQFDSTGDSGKATHRWFCPECGSTVTESADVMPGVIMVPAGTLDDASWVTPTVEIYCQSAQPWVHADGERKRFDKMPG